MDMQQSTVQQIIKLFGKSQKDSGRATVQVALLTKKIQVLTEHFKVHKKDYHSQRGLLKMISQRKKLLNYLKKSHPEQYQTTIQKLSLRK